MQYWGLKLLGHAVSLIPPQRLSTHAPETQRGAAKPSVLQSLPQPPQLARLRASSTHAPLQSAKPGLQTQAPPLQYVLDEEHWWPQLPQLNGSFWSVVQNVTPAASVHV